MPTIITWTFDVGCGDANLAKIELWAIATEHWHCLKRWSGLIKTRAGGPSERGGAERRAASGKD